MKKPPQTVGASYYSHMGLHKTILRGIIRSDQLFLMSHQTDSVQVHEAPTITHHSHLEILDRSNDADLFVIPGSMKICVLGSKGLKNHDLTMVYSDETGGVYATSDNRYYIMKGNKLFQAKRRWDYSRLLTHHFRT